MQQTIQAKIIHLLQHKRVMNLKSLQDSFDGRSQRSLFRDLLGLDYFTSYSHAGSFYTLKTTPTFDSNGLWHFNDIGFSKRGNLRDTITYFINSSRCGLKHLDLKDLLQIPVYNTLLDLTNSKEIARVNIDGSYLYVSKNSAASKLQLEMVKKRQLEGINLPIKNIPPRMAIEVLTEIIRESRVTAEPLKIAARLSIRGVKITFEQVKEVLEFYEVKKNPPMK